MAQGPKPDLVDQLRDFLMWLIAIQWSPGSVPGSYPQATAPLTCQHTCILLVNYLEQPAKPCPARLLGRSLRAFSRGGESVFTWS